ncbi:MAG: cytochrome c [Acidobacteriota bacterium]
MTPKRLVLALFVAAIAVAIGSAHISANTKAKKPVTYTKDIAPIFYKNCAECHRANDIAPMSLMSYKESRPWAKSIKEKVLSREMPPWSPDPQYGEFANDCRLSQADIETVVAWVDQGAKEGNPKDLPPVPEAAKGGWSTGKPDVVFELPQEWTVEPNAPDNYINFWVPTNFAEDKWIQSAEILPGNRKVVHHVIAFLQSPKIAEARMKAEKEGTRTSSQEGGGMMYWDGTLRRVKMDAPVNDDTCAAQPTAGGPGGGSARRGAGAAANPEAQEGALLAGYAPGKQPDVWPVGMAKRVPAGSYIMFQMHYSAFSGGLNKAEKDRTKIGLKFAKEPPDKMMITAGVVNATFKIPAGADNHEVKACMTVPANMQLVTYMPHMHMRGKDMRYDVVYPDGRQETLLNVPQFNFNWQTMYYLKNPVTLPKGTKVIVTAHFDNSTKNKYNPDPKKDVRWGDPTYDEMMIGWFDIIVDNPLKPKKDAAGTKPAGGQQ